MPDLKGALTKKIGPLPAWGWAVAVGGGILAWRMLRGGSGSGSPFAGTGTETASGGTGALPSYNPATSTAPIGFDPSSGALATGSSLGIGQPSGISQAFGTGLPTFNYGLFGSPGISPVSTGPTIGSALSAIKQATLAGRAPINRAVVTVQGGPTVNRTLASPMVSGPELTSINRGAGIMVAARAAIAPVVAVVRPAAQTAAAPVTAAAATIATRRPRGSPVAQPTIKPAPVPTTRKPSLIAR